MNLVQNDFTFASNTKDKMDPASKYPISQPRRKEFDDTMNQIEKVSLLLREQHLRIAWNHCFSFFCLLLQLPAAKNALAQSVSHSRTN